MTSRQLDVLYMLRGCRQRLREVRDDISEDNLLSVRHRLWKAEQSVKEAEAVVTGLMEANQSAEPPPTTEPDKWAKPFNRKHPPGS